MCSKESMHWILCLKGSYLFSKGGSFRGVSREGLNRILNSFPDVSFNVLMLQKEFEIILWSASLFYFYLGFVCYNRVFVVYSLDLIHSGT